MYFGLLDLAYANNRLTIRLASLVGSKPDDDNTITFMIGSESATFTVIFDDISEFRSKAEPCFSAEGATKDITEFLFECIDSQFVKEACPFGAIEVTQKARHFCVFTEDVVIEVLSGKEPKIEKQ